MQIAVALLLGFVSLAIVLAVVSIGAGIIAERRAAKERYRRYFDTKSR